MKKACGQSPAAVKKWHEEDYPSLRQRPRLRGPGFYGGAESGLRSDDVRGRGFALTGQMAEHADAIQLFYLPSYSAELGPDEMANADIQQAVMKLAPACAKLQWVKATLRDLRSEQRQFERIQKYFQHDPVRYAA